MSVPTVPLQFADARAHLRLIANAVNHILRGRGNNTGTVTLQANAASTAVIDARIAFDSAILLMPRTANAAAEIGNGTIYVVASGRLNGTVAIAHANNAQTDRTFTYAIQG